MFSKRSVFSTLGLMFVVGATSWLSVRTSTPPEHNSKMHVATSIAQDITITKMTKTGQVKYITHAQKAVQYNNAQTFLTQLSGTLFDQNNPQPWHYSAKRGLITNQGNEAHLSQDVIAYRYGTPSYPPIRFTTQSITLYPNKNYVDTDSPIKIEEPNTKNITTATGLKGYLNQKRVELLHNVKSQYASEASTDKS